MRLDSIQPKTEWTTSFIQKTEFKNVKMTGKQVRVDVTAAEYFLINLKDLIEQYGYSTGHILY